MEDINFNKLEQEFHRAQFANAKYSRENDAKFRAVHQKVATYEEFCDIVKASHLSPVDMKEITNTEKRSQPWNSLYANSPTTSLNNNGQKPSSSDMGENKPSNLQHRSTSDFLSCDRLVKQWKQLTTDVVRMEFLVENVACLSGALLEDIPQNLFEEVICVMNKSVNDVNAHVVVDVLNAFAKSKRFALSLKFLSKQEKKIVSGLLQSLEGWGKDVDCLKMLYNVT